MRATGVALALAATLASSIASAASAASGLPTGRTTYRTLASIDAEVTRIVADNPGTVRGIDLPHASFEGRHMSGFEIASGVGDPGESARPVLFIQALTHAREWPTVEVAMEFAHELVDGLRHKDKRITSLLKRARVVFVPLVNPDGFNASRSFQDTDVANGNPDSPLNILLEGLPPSGGTLAYRRDTCSGELPPWAPCFLQTGVDPNRNYSVNWGGDGASSIAMEQDYRGPYPYSESEVQNIREISASLNSPVSISLHTVAAQILGSPSKADGKAVPADVKAMKTLADAMTDATGYPNSTGPGLGYDTVGDSNDFGYYAMGEYAYTIELGPSDGNFHGPYSESVVDQYLGSGKTAGKGAREALLRALAATADPAASGRLLVRAPKGTALELHRVVQVPTSEICSAAFGLPGLIGINTPLQCLAPGKALVVDEPHTMHTTVPKSGRLTWSVPPSTRAFEELAGKREAYELRCTRRGRTRKVGTVAIARGERSRVTIKRC